jgi:hypothetical protein
VIGGREAHTGCVSCLPIHHAHSTEGEPNHLVISDVQLPREEAHVDSRKYDEDKGGEF